MVTQVNGSKKVVVVIPARYQSSRFPGKPLANLEGKPLIQHVYERVRTLTTVHRVVIATDDQRIVDAVKAFGGDVVMTANRFQTGSDRVAAVAQEVPADVYINLQGDEIPLSAALVDDLIRPFVASGVGVGTLKRVITDERERLDPNVVKVVTDRYGDALYFSRSPIPYVRDYQPIEGRGHKNLHWKHLGIYAYTNTALARFAGLAAGILEQAEQLEQLRLLEEGIRIRVWETQEGSLRIDTPDDLARAAQVLMRGEPAWQNSSL